MVKCPPGVVFHIARTVAATVPGAGEPPQPAMTDWRRSPPTFFVRNARLSALPLKAAGLLIRRCAFLLPLREKVAREAGRMRGLTDLSSSAARSRHGAV